MIVRIRPAEERDLELMLAWRNNPKLYKWFKKQDGPLKWEDHIEWFRNRPEGREDYIIQVVESNLQDDRRVGSVWVGEDNEVGIYIGEYTLWGESVAKKALGAVMDTYDDLWCGMNEDNERSQALFESMGFTLDDVENGRRYYSL